jgi:hypothetical protein
LHRQVGWLLAFENAVNVTCRAPVLVRSYQVRRDQAAAGSVVAVRVGRGQSVLGSQRDDLRAVHELRRISPEQLQDCRHRPESCDDSTFKTRIQGRMDFRKGQGRETWN